MKLVLCRESPCGGESFSELCRPSVGRRGLLCIIWWPVVCDLDGLLCSSAVSVVRIAHVSCSLFIDPSLLFVDMGIGGVTREDGHRCSESVAVLAAVSV